MSEGKPDATESLNLMVSYYQAHPYRGLIHFLITLITGGVWVFWFVGFYIGTLLGFKDYEAMREL